MRRGEDCTLRTLRSPPQRARSHEPTALIVGFLSSQSFATALPLARQKRRRATADGGGLYLRKRGASLTRVLRLTDPASGSQQWHRLFPDNPTGTYSKKSLADARQEAHRL